MAASAAKLGGGFLALAAIWGCVFWMWEPARAPTVTFAEPGDASETQTPPPEQPREVAPERSATPQPPTQAEPSGPVAGQTPPGEPPAGVIPPEFRDYTVRQGDSFESISKRFFGTTRHADAIKSANAFVSPTSLRVGQVLRVPVDPQNVQGLPVEGPGPGLPEPAYLEYTVVKGDTLSQLAQRFYGSLRYAEAIFDANRETMRTKDDLAIGDVLRIPSRESVLGPEDDR